MVWFLVAVGFLCSIVFLISRCSWKKGRKENLARISFKKFYELYSKEPWRWNLRDDYVRFDSYPFTFTVEFETYLDVLKYKRFRKKVFIEQQKEEHGSKQKDLEKEFDKLYGEEKKYGKQ